MSPRIDLRARLSSQLVQALLLFLFLPLSPPTPPPLFFLFCWDRRGLLVPLSVTRISSKSISQKTSHQSYIGLSCRRWSADFFLCRNYYFLVSLLRPPPLERCISHLFNRVKSLFFFPCRTPSDFSNNVTANRDQNFPCIWECLNLAARKATVFQINIYICVLFVADTLGNN